MAGGFNGSDRGAGRGATLGAGFSRGGATGFGGGVRAAGSRLPQCAHSRLSSEFSCAQKGQKRMPAEESYVRN